MAMISDTGSTEQLPVLLLNEMCYWSDPLLIAGRAGSVSAVTRLQNGQPNSWFSGRAGPPLVHTQLAVQWVALTAT
jgi:hypothetical protein